jgi:hypothetical protein
MSSVLTAFTIVRRRRVIGDDGDAGLIETVP